jgi:hypothetical protein
VAARAERSATGSLPIRFHATTAAHSGSSAAPPARWRSSACTHAPTCDFVRAGTLDDPSEVVPDVHIVTRSKLDWITLPASVPAFEVYYDRTALWPGASLERLDAL